MVSGVLVNLPVQTKFRLVVDLGTVHTEVVLAARVFGDHQRQRDEVASIHGPCLGYRELGQIVGQPDALCFAFSHLLGRHCERITEQR